MRESLSRQQRDETLPASVFSNGYNGDESLFNKSENEYVAENLSDSEVISPASRHSWDHINRYCSPYSSSPFSRVSYSPESSVCREAKKRLSERWAMMSYNGNCHEQKHAFRSSSTLGEMLAVSDVKNWVRSEEGDGNPKQESRGSTSCFTGDLNKDGRVDNSPRNLLRSKSVPISSTVYSTRLDVGVSDPEVGKTDASSNEVTKARSMNSLLKGKVSSLFFSRNKKSDKEKPMASQSTRMPVRPPGKICDDRYQCLNDLQLSFSKASSLDLASKGSKQGIISPEGGLSVTKPVVFRSPNENQDQPSPISVLEPPFEEDYYSTSESYGNVKPNRLGLALPVHHMKSDLIDRSPPIGSVARTLSQDDFFADTACSYPSKSSSAFQRAEEEHEWFFFVQKLLSVAGFDGEVQSDSFLARWHSPESPLDPSLRDNYVDLNDKEIAHEAKRRQKRSTRKLVFDCVNAALVDITGYGSDTCQRDIPCSMVHSGFLGGVPSIMADQVRARVKEWCYGEVRCVSGEDRDSNSLVVERIVRYEVVGKGWIEHLRLEIDNLGKEIEGKLLEELVQEALVELTGRV
ncbi:unnamed protein product [Ilex paraguariensis]|uniref:DUF4378 domain-containing protein n=1 Tax=Ilex paraguariensis TaxID=185542 RepID=A0ABC8R7Y4_9AQUA